MSKVTSKLQVTLPKALADAYQIEPGDEIEWIEAGDSIRVLPPSRRRPRLDAEARLALFDRATARQGERNEDRRSVGRTGDGRGWKREDLYDRGRPR